MLVPDKGTELRERWQKANVEIGNRCGDCLLIYRTEYSQGNGKDYSGGESGGSDRWAKGNPENKTPNAYQNPTSRKGCNSPCHHRGTRTAVNTVPTASRVGTKCLRARSVQGRILGRSGPRATEPSCRSGANCYLVNVPVSLPSQRTPDRGGS